MTAEEELLTLLLEELADPREVPGRSEVFIASIPRNLAALVVQHPGPEPLHTHNTESQSVGVCAVLASRWCRSGDSQRSRGPPAL